jgi:hypothetical protein
VKLKADLQCSIVAYRNVEGCRSYLQEQVISQLQKYLNSDIFTVGR